jgi:hypothetical protein
VTKPALINASSAAPWHSSLVQLPPAKAMRRSSSACSSFQEVATPPPFARKVGSRLAAFGEQLMRDLAWFDCVGGSMIAGTPAIVILPSFISTSAKKTAEVARGSGRRRESLNSA